MHNLLDTLIFLWNTRRWRTRKRFSTLQGRHQRFKVKGILCSSIKNPSPLHGRSLEIPSGGGVLKAKFLEGMYENKL